MVDGGFFGSQRFIPNPQAIFVPELIDVLYHDNPDVRQQALQALTTLSANNEEAALEAVIKSLDHEDAKIRSQAIQGLVKIGPHAKGAFPAVVAAMHHEDPTIRGQARTAVVNMDRTPGIIDSLSALIEGFKKGNAEERKAILFALKKMGIAAKEAVPVLRQALPDEDKNLRNQIDEALGAIEK